MWDVGFNEKAATGFSHHTLSVGQKLLYSRSYPQWRLNESFQKFRSTLRAVFKFPQHRPINIYLSNHRYMSTYTLPKNTWDPIFYSSLFIFPYFLRIWNTCGPISPTTNWWHESRWWMWWLHLLLSSTWWFDRYVSLRNISISWWVFRLLRRCLASWWRCAVVPGEDEWNGVLPIS